MQNPSEPQADDAPLYIRWSPDRSPYAIELKLDLVPKIVKELAKADRLGIEVGGVLVGSFPDAYMPTIRVEDVEMIPRGAEDGATYLLDPNQQAGFAQVRWGARARGTAALGLFRSHLRSGPLRPSLADRSLLSAQFKQAIYAALLVQGKPPTRLPFSWLRAASLGKNPRYGNSGSTKKTSDLFRKFSPMWCRRMKISSCRADTTFGSTA